jgi:hypothetical protein
MPPAPADGPESVSGFLERVDTACGEEDAAVIDQARTLLEEACVHLPARRSSGVEPVGRLESLRGRLPATRARLYRELLSIFSELGDRHTRCCLPPPFAGRFAYVPLVVGELFAEGRPQLCVLWSDVENVRRGDILVSWNGAPVEEAIRDQMALQHGANPEARRAMAVQTLTFRPLDLLPPPDGGVAIEILSAQGRCRASLDWRVAEGAWLFAHYGPTAPEDLPGRGAAAEGFQARVVETSSGSFGCIRVASFNSRPEVFLEAFLAALSSLPPDGLILDLRGCETGIIATGEQLLQLFAEGPVEPQRFQFRVTDLVLRLVRRHASLAGWREAVEAAAQRGDTYSAGRPLTPPELANGVGRRYRGPVVILVDALTYSTAEMLAAGFQDHGIGTVLGTAPRTGGGGAAAWPQTTLFRLTGDEALRPLPGAPAFRVAVQRCARVGARAGRPIEELGVVPDTLHRMTRDDLLSHSRDLLEKAGEILVSRRRGATPASSRGRAA